MFLDREEYLFGIDRLDKIIGYLSSKGLVHNMLLLTLGNHNNRHMRETALYGSKGVKPAETRHILIKEDKVDRTLF